MKYKQHIVDYAIDNKVSLEEAYAHFIVKGREEKEEKFKEEYQDKAEDLEDPERYTDLYGDQPNIDEAASLSPGEEDPWAKYKAIKKDLERLYEEYSNEITQEEMDWVERELKEVDKMYNNEWSIIHNPANKSIIMKKRKGIIEELRASTSLKQVGTLEEKLKGYDYASDKTIRKFVRLRQRKIKSFKNK